MANFKTYVIPFFFLLLSKRQFSQYKAGVTALKQEVAKASDAGKTLQIAAG